MVFGLQPPFPAFADAWLCPTGCPRWLGTRRGRGCAQGCAQGSAVTRGARTAPGGGVVRCSGVPGGGDGGWGRGVRRGSVPRVSCPKRASPQTPPYAQGGDPSVRPPRKAKLSTPRRDRSPGEDPARRGNGTNPKTSKRAVEPPRPPAGAGSPPPHPRAGGSGGLGGGRGGGGEETQPGEHVKSLRRGRWKITLAPSRPVLLCAARRAIFPKKLSKTKSAPFGSAALGPPPVGQASTFRGRVGAIRAALRRGCWAGGFPAEPPTPAPPAPPRPPRPQPASLGPAAPAPAPRLSPPLKPTGGKGIFWGGLVLDTSRGTWGTRSRCPPAPPPAIPIPPRGCPGCRRPAAALAKTRDEKVEGLMFSDRYK